MYGTCKICGCTDKIACPDGCAWVDAQHTLCSACLAQVDGEQLGQLVTEEMIPIAEAAVEVHLTLGQLLAVVLAVQIAQRNPQCDAGSRELLGEVIEDFSQAFAPAPATAELIRRGAADAQPASTHPGP